MLVWDEVDRCWIHVNVVFSGKHLPNVGYQPAWRGSGSLACLDKLERHGHGSLISPEELRGKTPHGTWNRF